MSETNAPPVGESKVTDFSQTEGRQKRSQTIGKIGAALAKAQGEMENAEKDVKGNFGKYATLAATWDAIRPALSKNEIAVYQRPLTIAGTLKMCTMLIHSSGEFIDDGELEMIFDRTGGRITPMQAMGSAVTYARRYTLQAATGVAPADDDDGAGAGKPQAAAQPKTAKPNPPPAPKSGLPPNKAPASDETMNIVYNLALERQVKADEINYLIKSYGVYPNQRPENWIAQEIIKFMENEDTSSIKVMAEAQRVLSRREAARIKAEAEGKK